jgi:hypothetical protein
MESSRKMPKNTHPPIEEKAELPSGYQQKHSNFHPFSLKGDVSVYIY